VYSNYPLSCTRAGRNLTPETNELRYCCPVGATFSELGFGKSLSPRLVKIMLSFAMLLLENDRAKRYNKSAIQNPKLLLKAECTGVLGALSGLAAVD
jgi:hypothetical protein